MSEDGGEHGRVSYKGISGLPGTFSGAVGAGQRSPLLHNARNFRPLNRRSRSAPSKGMQTTVDMLVAECLLGTDAHMRRAGGVLQRRRAEQERRVGWTESVRCFRAVTGMPVLPRRWLCVGQGGVLQRGSARKVKYDPWRLC